MKIAASLTAGGQGDGAVVVWLVFRANDGGDEGHKGKNVGYTGGVVLDASAKRGKLGQCALPEVEKGLEERSKAGFLVRRYGEGS